MRYLLLIFAIWVGVMIIRHFMRHSGKQEQKSRPAPVQDMVRCKHCGIHFPRAEAVMQGNDTFCSTEHRDARKQ